jgi:glutaredoxin
MIDKESFHIEKTLGRTKRMKVIIYTQKTCPPCHEEKLWLKEKQIIFEERDIRENPDFLDEIIQLGAAATPVTIIHSDSGEEVIYGFDQDKLAKLIGE